MLLTVGLPGHNGGVAANMTASVLHSFSINSTEARTMKAMVLDDISPIGSSPLRLREVTDSHAGAGEVRVQSAVLRHLPDPTCM